MSFKFPPVLWIGEHSMFVLQENPAPVVCPAMTHDDFNEHIAIFVVPTEGEVALPREFGNDTFPTVWKDYLYIVSDKNYGHFTHRCFREATDIKAIMATFSGATHRNYFIAALYIRVM